jgi:hypothetical protein
MSKIFLIRGYKGSGKDMVAEYLEKEHGFGKLSFATLLKDEACRQYSVPRIAGDDQSLKEVALKEYPVYALDKFSEHVNSFLFREFRTLDGKKAYNFGYDDNRMMFGVDEEANEIGQLYHCPRSLFILEGSVKRSVNPNYWVDTVVKQLNPSKNYIVPDWRYRSEVTGVKNAIAKLSVNLEVYTVEIQRFESNEIQSTDPSERDLDGFQFDFHIDNLKSKGTTKSQVFQQMEQIIDLVTGGN